MADDEAKDTQVYREDPGFDMEGTEEMDRAALLARIQADSQKSRSPNEPKTPRDSAEVLTASRPTEQQDAISEATLAGERPVGEQAGAPPDPTQHYVVPDSLIKKTRDTQIETVEVPIEAETRAQEDDDLPTTNFASDAFLEFEAVVDQHGRVALPDSALQGRFSEGARLKVIVSIIEDD